MAMTADQLVAAVNRRCGWASTNGPLADSASSETHEEALLALADEEMVADAYPLVVKTHGDYYLAVQDTAVVSGQRFYRLPDRAYGAVLDVLWGDTGATDDEFVSLHVIEREDLGRQGEIRVSTDVSVSRYFIDGDKIGLWPIPNASRGTLRVKYTTAPSRLAHAASGRYAVINAVAYDSTLAGALIVTLGAGLNPAAGDRVDIVSAGNAHAAILVNREVDDELLGAPVFEGIAVNPLVAAGDYLCSAGYSAIVQLPDHMSAYFVRRVAGACLEAQGDYEGADRQYIAARSAHDKALSTGKPRSQAEPRNIVTRNSPLRVGGYRYR